MRILKNFLWLALLLALTAQAVPEPAAKAPAAAQATASPALAAPAPAAEAAAPKRNLGNSTTDHTKLKELQKDFKSGPEVTAACLSCHTEAAKQIQATKHWTWEYLHPDSGQHLGKRHIVNNFCTAVPSNYQFCTACHVGYGWKDEKFDFSNQENVDCLVCHDTTGKYRKLPGFAGHPPYKDTEYPPHSGKIVPATDLKFIAQNIGKTSRATCGACHFYGGGGDAVKHGDLDSSMKNPPKYLDVHMDAKGLNFSCATCHSTAGHQVSGSRYAPTAVDKGGAILRGSHGDRNPVTCQACHGQKPHKAEEAKLNDHTAKVACQTCHVPTFARGGIGTKTLWDWSTAGKLTADGKPFTTKDSAGRVSYDSKKGDFRYGTYEIPEYIWFNGSVKYTLATDRLNPERVTKINTFEGTPQDGRIWPVKVFRGAQPYDKVTKTLLVPHTFGDDDSAFWSNFDWEKSLKAGMAAAGGNFSGEYGFVKTEMSWPITHMVAPKDDALECKQCHSRNGRLKNIEGVYIPGRDRWPWLDLIGFTLAGLALLGVIGHALIRVIAGDKHRKGHHHG